MRDAAALRIACVAALLAASWASDHGWSRAAPLGGAVDRVVRALRSDPSEDPEAQNFRYEILFRKPAAAAADTAFMYVDPKDVLFWKFIPRRSGRVLGEPFSVNSDGLADAERPVAKGPGVVRIAILGSSTALGYGVAPDQSFASLLQARLNTGRDVGRARVEALDFAVPGYTLSMALAQYDRKAAKYRPDVVVWCLSSDEVEGDITRFDESARWVDALRRRLWATSEDYYSEPYMARLQGQIEQAGVPTVPSRFLLHSAPERSRDCLLLAKTLLDRIKERADSDGNAAVVVFLPGLSEQREPASLPEGLAAAAAGAGLAFWDFSPRFRAAPERFSLGDAGGHFNAAGHALIAELLYRHLTRDPALASRLGRKR